MVIVSKGWNYQFFAVIGLITSITDECACIFMDGLFHFLSWPDYSNSTHSAVWNSWILALSCLKWRRQLALTNDCLQLLYCKILISLNRLHDQVVACLALKFSPPSTIPNWVLLYYSRSKSKQHNFYISYGYIEWTIDLLHSFGKEETFISSFTHQSWSCAGKMDKKSLPCSCMLWTCVSWLCVSGSLFASKNDPGFMGFSSCAFPSIRGLEFNTEG